jgi:hypothetical protein
MLAVVSCPRFLTKDRSDVRKTMRLTTAVLIPAVALGLGLVAPSASATARTPARALPCHASMTNSSPADYTSTGVKVRTVPFAHIKTAAHYRTTTHVKHRVANAHGRRIVWYYISGATPGYRVVVDVYVSHHHRTGSCRTSFTPHA